MKFITNKNLSLAKNIKSLYLLTRRINHLEELWLKYLLIIIFSSQSFIFMWNRSPGLPNGWAFPCLILQYLFRLLASEIQGYNMVSNISAKSLHTHGLWEKFRHQRRENCFNKYKCLFAVREIRLKSHSNSHF